MKLQKLTYTLARVNKRDEKTGEVEVEFELDTDTNMQTGVCVVKEFGLYDIGTIIAENGTVETRPLWNYWLHWGAGTCIDTEIESTPL